MIWAVVGMLAVFAGGTLAWSLRRQSKTGEPAANRAVEYDLEVYRDQLRELEKDLERGVIQENEAEAARNEIRRRVLNAKATDDSGASTQPLSRSTVWLLALAVPVLSLSLYAILGRPDLADRQQLTVQKQQRGPSRADVDAAARMTPEQRQQMIQGMVDRLAARLKENPNDLAGWLRLGRVRSVLKQHKKAAEAYAKAAALAPKNVRVLTVYAMAVLRTQPNEGPISPGVVALMKRLYALEPRHPLALYYLGKNAFDLGRPKEGKDYWRRLLPLIKDRPDFAARIRKRLDQDDD